MYVSIYSFGDYQIFSGSKRMSFHYKITLEKEIFIDKNFIFEKKRVTVRWKQTDAQRAKIAEKVHKPPLWVNVVNFELNGFNAFIWVPWSLSDLKKL